MRSLRSTVGKCVAAALLLTCAFAVMFGLRIPSAQAGSLVVVLASDFPASQRQSIAEEIAKLLTALRPEDRVTLLAAPSGLRIAEVIVPASRAYAQQRHLLPLLRPAFEAVQRHLDRAVAASPPADGSAPSQLGIPGLIDALRYHVDAAGTPLPILMVGSIIYDDRRYPSFSMVGAVPEGNHYAQPLHVTPFALSGREGLLRAVVHICNTSDAAQWVGGARHRRGVEQFYSGYFAWLGSSLATVSDDIATCRARALAGLTHNAPAAPTIARDAAPVMVRIGPTLSVPATAVNPERAAQAALLSRMNVAANERNALRTEIDAGRVRLLEIEVADDQQPDGDVIGFRASTGAMVRVRLETAPTRIVVPIEADALTLVGLVDGGGGGITLLVRVPTANGAQVRTPILRPGEVLRVPVALN